MYIKIYSNAPVYLTIYTLYKKNAAQLNFHIKRRI